MMVLEVEVELSQLLNTSKILKFLSVSPLLFVGDTFSQDWRADAQIQDGDGGLTFIIILVAIGIYFEFKKGSKQGFIALIVCGALLGLVILIPQVGGVIIGLLLIATLYAVFMDYWR